MKNILIINEDREEANQIKCLLENENTTVLCADNTQKALEIFTSEELCLIVLDAHISSDDEYTLLRAMRKFRTTPILVLSSKVDCKERLYNLRAGAHAYMGKPYSIEECVAQAHSLMSMYIESSSNQQKGYALVCGKELLIDPEERKVYLKGKELHLTKTEFNLLFCFASNPGRVLSRAQLYDKVWNECASYNVDDVVKTHIKTLRQKLSESDKEYIKNVWGVGYRFQKENSD